MNMESRVNFRRMVCFVLLFFALAIANQVSVAQTVSVSPGDLSFGIPTGTPAPLTSTDLITVNVTGTGQATLSNFGIAGQNSVDFTFNGNTCLTQQTAPTTCQVGVQFTSTKPAGTLETATLSFSSSTQTAPITVPLNGAYGAIKLFGSININPSLISYITWTQDPPKTGYNVQSTNINLSCPAGATAVLSSTPDGSGNVFQDNTLEFVNTVGSSTTTTTDVCVGGDTNFQGFTGFPAGTSNCFQSPYESAATNYLGSNPDLATYPQSGGTLGSFVAQYGVAPLNVVSLLSLGSGNSSQAQSLTVDLQDAGGELGAATLHLVTSCSPEGITPGGTITGNPISNSNPSSLTQTYALDSSPGQTIALTDSVAQNPPASGAIPSVTDIGVPQQLFYQLVTGTSAAPAVCLRMAGELDSFGNPMCKGFLIQCTLSGTTSGDNCDPASPTMARVLYDAVQFASPDAPVNGSNFLYTPVPAGSPTAADACTYALGGTANAACAQNTGPGMLMGSDDWLTASGENPPNTSTPPSPATYSAGNCILTGSVEGDLCPLNTLTQFLGAADVAPGGTTAGKNSIIVPVVNVPLPSTTISNSNYQSNGWVPAPAAAATITFTANPASYSPAAINPPANTFVPAPAYSVTYGFTPASSPLPDTTYPVSGDKTLFNLTANPNFAAPLCSSSTTSSFTAPPVTVNPGQDGIYNLHFFTTDCALTEELVFNPQGAQLTNPTSNWASFRYVTFGVDTEAPTYACNSPSTGVWYNTNQTVACTVTDQDYVSNVSGSGFPPSANGIQGAQSESVNVSTNVPSGTVNSAAPTVPLSACDLAGNCVGVSAGPFKIDLQPPAIAGPTLSSSGPYYVNGPPVTVTYSCSDGIGGSGIASCAGTDALAGGGTVSIPSGGTITNSATGNYTITITAIDNAGNQSTSFVNYTVGTNTETTLTSSPNPSVQGKPVTFTAKVSSSSGTVTGFVVFANLNGNIQLGQASLKSGLAKFTTSALPPGSDPILAIYSGDSKDNGSTSAVLTQIVEAQTATKLSSSPDPSSYGQTVVFTATVTSSIGPPPNGEEVTFKQGSTTLGTGILSGGVATVSTSALGVGSKTITAVYAGDANFTSSTSPSISQVIGKEPTTTGLISSQNPSGPGTSVTFTATVSPQFGGTATGSVVFKNGTATLGTVTVSNGTASYTTSKLTAGAHNITSTYNGNSVLASSSAALTQTVN